MTEKNSPQCQRCNNPLGRRAKRYCSRSCSSKDRQTPEAIARRAAASRAHWADPKRKERHVAALRASHPKKEPFLVVCKHCGKAFDTQRPKHFCSRSCVASWTAQQPHVVELRRAAMRKHLLDPDSKLRAAVVERMTNANPSQRPEVREKIGAALRGRPAPHLNGGNGHGPTTTQLLLFSLLAPLGFEMESGIKLGKGSKTIWPGGIRFDLALPSERLGVELDGLSHNGHAVRERDARKMRLATERGWRVVRFKNAEILENLAHCVETIQSHLSPSKAEELRTQFLIWKSREFTATTPTDS